MEQMTTWSFNEARIHKNILRWLTIHLCSWRHLNHHASLCRWHDIGIQIRSGPQHLHDRTFQNARSWTNNSNTEYLIDHDCSCWSISLSQHRYTVEILQKFGMENCKPVSTPMEPGLWLSNDMSPKSEEQAHMKTIPYLAAMGSVMYLTMTTWPNLVYAAGALARFGSNPRIAHWNIVNTYCVTYKEQQAMHSPTVCTICQRNPSQHSQMLTTVGARTADNQPEDTLSR